jgi:hypothetical protein
MELHIIDVDNLAFTEQEITTIKSFFKTIVNPFSIEDLNESYRVIVTEGGNVYVTKEKWLRKRFESKSSPSSISMVESAVHENRLSNGEKFYTFGNLFGSESIIMDERFGVIKEQCMMAGLIGKKLKQVVVTFDDLTNQYILMSYKFR